jgi:hypothetical protein
MCLHRDRIIEPYRALKGVNSWQLASTLHPVAEESVSICRVCKQTLQMCLQATRLVGRETFDAEPAGRRLRR